MTDFIDGAGTVCLCDVGAPDYVATTVIAADGSEHFVLVLTDGLGDERVTYSPSCPDADHEQLGQLPQTVRDRIWAMGTNDIAYCQDGEWEGIYFCASFNKKGKPCGMRVQRQGDRCVFHHERQASR